MVRDVDGAAPSTTLAVVVPCFDEERRLPVERLTELAVSDGISLVLVDDGSTDDTLALLRSIAASSPTTTVVELNRNVGKGEAVRRGLIAARTLGTAWVGYLDADLATSPDELVRLSLIAAGDPELDVVMAARVGLLGRTVVRSSFRHYTGRVFAMFARSVLDLAVYDTQCGAKLLRASNELDRAISVPFRSRWAFDVELLGRLRRCGLSDASMWEEPLRSWRDVAASRRSLAASVRSIIELGLIRRDLARWPRPDQPLGQTVTGDLVPSRP